MVVICVEFLQCSGVELAKGHALCGVMRMARRERASARRDRGAIETYRDARALVCACVAPTFFSLWMRSMWLSSCVVSLSAYPLQRYGVRILGAEIVHTCTMRVAHAHVLRKQSANDDIDKNIMITTGHTI